ncbi:MAG TPA: 4a-hydroxytetrahydrobiopterin dehydratase [Chroococcales cyanobacterium]|jgi:4a-hydroxytetrahydrobiopterin dehydratase
MVYLGLIATSVILTLAIRTVAQEVDVAQMTRLSEQEVTHQIQSLPDWMLEGKEIRRTFQFKNFVEAIDFVNRLVEPAEMAGHHPDLAISYNKVTVSLTTHDAGGLTQKDFDLAKTISQLAASSSN